ncbi:MAG: hypothetical protein AAF611_17450 [Bacteroidota bacterium]
MILLFIYATTVFSQSVTSNKNLEDYFKAYSQAIIVENVANELQLMHPKLFEDYSKEKAL